MVSSIVAKENYKEMCVIHDAIEMGLAFTNQFELSKICIHKDTSIEFSQVESSGINRSQFM